MLAGLPGVGLEGSAGHEGKVAVAAAVHHHLPGAGQGRDLRLASIIRMCTVYIQGVFFSLDSVRGL